MGKGRLKEALQLAGSQHKYQQILLILLVIAWISMVFVYLSSPFIYMDPLFHCASSGDRVIHEKQACKRISQCSVIDDFTLVAQVNLYCQKQWARVIIQSIFPLGCFVGLIIMNLLSDTRGRREAFLLSIFITTLGISSVLVGGSTADIYYLIIGQFLCGFGSYSIMPLAYTLASDFFSDKLRPRAIVILNASGGLATISLGCFYLLGFDWFHFIVFFQLIPFICLFIIFFFYLQQTPYILMNHNQIDHAQQVFYRISKFNGRSQNNAQIKRIIELQEERDKQKKPSFQNVIKTIKQWQYLKPIIILTTINAIANLNYFGISYSFAQQGLGYGYNCMVLGFVQSGSIIILTYTASHIARRPGIAIFYTLTMIVGLSYLTDFVEGNLVISTFLIGLSRVFSVNGYCLVACVQTEAFVVSIQSTAVGLVEGLGILGAVIAPIIIQIGQKLQMSPIAICAFCVTFAIWPAYFLKQTFHVPAPQPLVSVKELTQPLNKTQIQLQLITNQNSKQKVDLKAQKQSVK